MSALARVLVQRGYSVSGSDIKNSPSLTKLEEEGLMLFQEQSATNIQEIQKLKEFEPLVVISTAVRNSNLELQAAQAQGLSICHRADILSALIQQQ